MIYLVQPYIYCRYLQLKTAYTTPTFMTIYKLQNGSSLGLRLSADIHVFYMKIGRGLKKLHSIENIVNEIRQSVPQLHRVSFMIND